MLSQDCAVLSLSSRLVTLKMLKCIERIWDADIVVSRLAPVGPQQKEGQAKSSNNVTLQVSLDSLVRIRGRDCTEFLSLPGPFDGARGRKMHHRLVLLKLAWSFKDPIVRGADRQAVQSVCWPNKHRLFRRSGGKRPGWMLVFLHTNDHYEHLFNLQPADFDGPPPLLCQQQTDALSRTMSPLRHAWRIRACYDARWHTLLKGQASFSRYVDCF